MSIKENNYVVGLDIGNTSVGYGVIDVENNKLIETGTRHFEKASQASDRRLKRSARRGFDRKRWRNKQLKKAFNDFGIIDEKTIEQPNYLVFTYDGENITRPIDDTVYHLRKRALNEKVSERELLLALYNICKTRGHFLMETIDFEKSDNLTFEYFKEKFYDWTSVLFEYNDDRSEFENVILNPIFNKKLYRSNDIKSKLKNINIIDEDSNDRLLELLKLITGFECKLQKITDNEELIKDKTKVKVSGLKSDDPTNVTDFLSYGVELYDLIQINSVISNHDFLCEVAVENLDKLKQLYLKKDTNEVEYNDFIKDIKSKMNVKKANEKGDSNNNKNESIKVVKNLDNSYPNGLYVKEAKCILRKQQEFNDKITDEFIEVVGEIISARIPFYIGPLSPNGKNAWIEDVNHEFKYSYNYTQKHFNAIDEAKAIKNWKERMISHCTYLPDEYALPRGSFIYEIYAILNEMNILQAIDHNGEEYLLTKEDKYKIINQLFLESNESKVKFKLVKELLDLDYFGDAAGNMKSFNNSISLYKNIINLIPRLKLKDIRELFIEKDKIDEIEEIILNISLFDEEKSKANYFKEKYDEEISSKLAKLNIKGFNSLSRKFLMEEEMNIDGSSMMELLFEDNTSNSKNEQMTIISNAVNEDGSPKDLVANKYIKLMKDSHELSIDLLIDEGKPLIPMSRPVIRGLNETFKVYQDIIKMYGVPKRLVIETARDFYGETKINKKHKDELKDVYDNLIDQLKTKENAHLRKYSSLEDWDEIESYLSKNKEKIELYVKQLGCDMIDGKPIDLNNLLNYEVDHILPRGFGDDSMDNKMLISKIHNAKKSNRVPLEYIGSEETNTTCKNFKDRVDNLYKLNAISSKKKERLLLPNTDIAIGFVNQDLVDTRYIIREFTSILKAFNSVNNYDTEIVNIKATYTGIARNVFGFKKNRDFGLQHHAHDASLIAIMDTCLRAYFPAYDKRNNLTHYNKFIESIKNLNDDKNNKNDIKYIIYGAYHKAFGQSCTLGNSVINQLKEIVPLYSEKVIKNSDGKFYKETLETKDKYNKNKPLEILDINKENRVFSSINCAAVDFYRYKNKKGEIVHAAIHLPKVIINKGIINKEKYIKLIKDYYKYNDLIDENGEIKEYYFRFRAFNGDIIYDIFFKIPQVFVCGSIKNKNIQMNLININSYNDIYLHSKELFNHIVNRFDLRDQKGKIKYNDDDFKLVKEYLIKYTINEFKADYYKESYIKMVDNLLSNNKSLITLCDVISYTKLWLIKPSIPKSIIGQNMLSLNRKDFNGEQDIEYIKIKHSALGIRWKIEDGKLKIYGPHGNQNAYKWIRKEKFSWHLSKYDV